MTRASLTVLTLLATGAAVLPMWHGTVAEQQTRDGSWQSAPTTPQGPPGTFKATPAQMPFNQEAASRSVEWDGKDLRTHLLPSDSRVSMVRSVSPPLTSLPRDPVEELSLHVQRADAVVVLRPTSVIGKLNERADWIDSTVIADIVEVLKESPKHPLRIGASIQVNHQGGELAFDGKQIRAMDEGDVLPEQGHDYLYFLLEYNGKLHAFPLNMTFGLTDAGVKRLGPGTSTAAFSASEFLSVVRERAALNQK